MDGAASPDGAAAAVTSPVPRPPGAPGPWEAVAIATVSAAVSLATVVGNALVLMSFRVDGRLRTVGNYYLLSLACADLIIGLFSMNLYTAYVLMGRWALGSLACDLWLALDYVASNASVMSLLAISFDRYFSVTRPLTYRAGRTPRQAGLLIGLAWLASFVLWAPAILGWPLLVGERTAPAGECQIRFLSEPVVTFGTAIAAFYVPAAVMTVLNCRIYRETRRRAEELARLRAAESGAPARRVAGGRRTVGVAPGPAPPDVPRAGLGPRGTERKRMVPVRGRKAARTLSAVLLAFILTWTPYNILVLVSAFCLRCTPAWLWHLGYWLCYVNSAVNPVCYALCNRGFRRTFRLLLLGRWGRRRRPRRAEGRPHPRGDGGGLP
ncbi:muscarinic acetylcholine receptor M5 [Ornithorhynchus anatinus]|uniref:muscarinic acetylcholine receptor M5 n=1 Tax=Ornithorhynchus anatinus TaxID=9258 RepID=UPI0010A7B910|nr:muscarinic acetylcholine receptor M5 [Ornithorhynchus anatinus]